MSLHPRTRHNDPLDELRTPVQFVKGVGPDRARLLNRLGLKSVADLLFFFPRRYQDFSQPARIADLIEGEPAAVIGTVCDIDQSQSGGRHVLYILVRQEDGQFLRGVWFNQPFMRAKFSLGQPIQLRGRPLQRGGRWQMSHPQVTWIEPGQDVPDSGWLPVYSLTEGLKQSKIRQIIAGVVDEYSGYLVESLPESLRSELELCDLQTAVRQIHRPRNEAQLEMARRRLVFQELFVLQLALAIRRHRVRASGVADPMELNAKIRARILDRLPFELSATQQNAFEEIAADMGRAFPMNRLLHGEVGSGKTLVAICAMMLAVANGHQAVLMAPTEILAQQHVETLERILKTSRVRIGAFTGRLTERQRAERLRQVEQGEIDILIGTTALVHASIRFPRLGLVVIDEQHKFGVRQRSLLRQSGFDPHYLVMTATPIPRTISMTLFGDLDVSTLHRSADRGAVVHTYLGTGDRRQRWWDFFCRKLDEGRQGYVVAPLVQGDDESRVEGAEALYETLTNGPLEAYRLGRIHGRLSAEEKLQTMRDFADGRLQVLVATGVIEVGIDVPNATVMTIESAERFGLSQLHQLRGRVGRGRHPGYVCAFSSCDAPEAIERLEAFEKHNDGFELAEIDLRLRGPGNLFGTQQTGFPPLRIADLTRDQEWLEVARQQARKLVEQDPELAHPDRERLKQLVTRQYARALELGDVG